MRTSYVIAGIAVLGACHPHAEIKSAPSRIRTSPERVEAFNRLMPLINHQTIGMTGFCGGTGLCMFGPSYIAPSYLQLRGGERVYHPEDLRAAVLPNSPIADAMDRASSNRKIDHGLLAGGIAAGVGGLATVIASTVYQFNNINHDLGSPNFGEKPSIAVPLAIGISLAVVGTGLVVGSFFAASAARDEKATVFDLFPGALKERLNLCGPNNQVEECSPAR